MLKVGLTNSWRMISAAKSEKSTCKSPHKRQAAICTAKVRDHFPCPNGNRLTSQTIPMVKNTQNRHSARLLNSNSRIERPELFRCSRSDFASTARYAIRYD